MPTFELANIRWELNAAIAELKDETPGDVTGRSESRTRVFDHLHTAMLLLHGSASSNIMGHPSGSSHPPQ